MKTRDLRRWIERFPKRLATGSSEMRKGVGGDFRRGNREDADRRIRRFDRREMGITRMILNGSEDEDSDDESGRTRGRARRGGSGRGYVGRMSSLLRCNNPRSPPSRTTVLRAFLGSRCAEPAASLPPPAQRRFFCSEAEVARSSVPLNYVIGGCRCWADLRATPEGGGVRKNFDTNRGPGFPRPPAAPARRCRRPRVPEPRCWIAIDLEIDAVARRRKVHLRLKPHGVCEAFCPCCRGFSRRAPFRALRPPLRSDPGIPASPDPAVGPPCFARSLPPHDGGGSTCG